MCLKSRLSLLIFGMICVFIFAGGQPVPEAIAGDTASAVQTTNPTDGQIILAGGGSTKKGKYLFKKTCKKCHSDGAEGGELTPVSFIIEQWEEFFAEDVHQGDEKLSTSFKPEDLEHIRAFLIKFAADSEQPMTCG